MELPGELVADLLGVIRGQFYGDLPARRFFQDRAFLLRHVVLWPAAWLDRRGVTIRPERYRQILLAVFQEIKHHGATAAVRYWPGYLAKCVQDHFAHHGEEYYQEGKCLRAVLERSMDSIRGRLEAPPPDPVRTLVLARDAIIAARRKARCKSTQPSLPGL